MICRKCGKETGEKEEICRSCREENKEAVEPIENVLNDNGEDNLSKSEDVEKENSKVGIGTLLLELIKKPIKAGKELVDSGSVKQIMLLSLIFLAMNIGIVLITAKILDCFYTRYIFEGILYTVGSIVFSSVIMWIINLVIFQLCKSKDPGRKSLVLSMMFIWYNVIGAIVVTISMRFFITSIILVLVLLIVGVVVYYAIFQKACNRGEDLALVLTTLSIILVILVNLVLKFLLDPAIIEELMFLINNVSY